MARTYSPRPLTPGVVTIWYRAPEILLGSKYYTPSVDLWSAGLVLAELLQSAPLLTGETPFEQLSLTVKLLGCPTDEDLSALSALGCPELIRWRREALASGQPDTLERRFLASTSTETVNFLNGLLKWDPPARWTAVEALGKGRSRYSAMAEKWWKESPRAADRGFIPTYPEVRNGVVLGDMEYWGKRMKVDDTHVTGHGGDGGGYIFDFDGDSALRRSLKRPRPR